MRRSLLIAAVVLILAVAGVALVGCSNVRIDESDVFLPKPSVTPATFDREGVTLTPMTFRVPTRADSAEADSAEADSAEADSLALDAWYLTQPDAKATVLFFGGNGFYLVQSKGYIDALTQHPVNVFLWDYRGYGRSEGEPSVPGFKQDALAAYDVVTGRLGADPGRVIVHGHSLGTFLATHTATERDVGGVVLENPATDVRGWVNSIAPWYVRLFVDLEIDPVLRKESNVERIRSLTAPLFIAGGTEDNVTNPDMARTLHEEAASEHKRLVLVEGKGHNGVYEDSTYQAAYRDLVTRTAAPVAAGQ